MSLEERLKDKQEDNDDYSLILDNSTKARSHTQ